MTAALRNGAFRRLAAFYSLNALLEWVGTVALLVMVYDATSDAVAVAVMLVCKQVVPGVIVPRLGGRIDRTDARAVSAFSWGLSAASLLVAGLAGYGWWVFPLSALAGLGVALVRTVLRARVPTTVGAGDLRGANALLNLVIGVSVPVVPALAALAIYTQGAPAVLVAAGASLLLLALLGLLLFPDASVVLVDDDLGSERVHRGGTSDAASGSSVPMSWLMYLGGASVAATAMTEPSLLAFSVETLEAGVGAYGAICTAWAVGATLGSLLFTRLLGLSMLRVYAVATLVSAGAYLVLGLASSVQVAAVAALVGGVGTGMDWVAIVTAVQERAATGRETQVAARLEGVAMAAPTMGILVGGALADAFSPRVAVAAPGLFLFGVLGVLAVGLAVRASGRRSPVAPFLVSPPVRGGSA